MSALRCFSRHALALVMVGWAASVSHADTLYVSSVGNNSVSAYGPTGNFIGSFSSTPPLLDAPFGIQVGPTIGGSTNTILVASLGTSSVIALDATNLTFLGTVIASGDHGLHNPSGMAFDPGTGNLFINSFQANQIYEYHWNGSSMVFQKVLINGGAGSTSDPGLVGPTGLAYNAATGTLYASSSDASTNRIQAYTNLASPTVTVNNFAAGIGAPAGILALTSPVGTKNVSVWTESFSNNQIAGYTSAGGGIPPVVGIANGVPGVPFISGPSDVAINAANNIFVTNSGANNILEFTPDGAPVGSGIFIPSGGVGGPQTPTYLLWDTGVTALGGPGVVALIPEPSSVVLLGLGGIAVAAYSRRRRPVA
jgi:hypothetical protein